MTRHSQPDQRPDTSTIQATPTQPPVRTDHGEHPTPLPEPATHEYFHSFNHSLAPASTLDFVLWLLQGESGKSRLPREGSA